MDLLVFGEKKMNGFIPKTSYVTAIVVFVSWFGVELVILALKKPHHRKSIQE
jgi:hypothetical protein